MRSKKNGFEQGHIKFLALFKLADLVQTVYRPIRRFPSDEEFEIWHREFLGLHCRWDKVKQCYTFQDGSVLPPL
jgi:hypothetical protein